MTHYRFLFLVIGLSTSVATGLLVDRFSNNALIVIGVLVFGVSLFTFVQSRSLIKASTSLSAPLTAEPRVEQRVVPAGSNIIRSFLFDLDGTEAVVRGVSAIEQLAGYRLGVLPDGPAPSLFKLRAELQDQGIWTHEAVEAFDRAMSVRNRIVHGESHQVSSAEMKQALEDIPRLMEPLVGRAAIDRGRSEIPPDAQVS